MPQTGTHLMLIVAPRYITIVEKVGERGPIETRKRRGPGRSVCGTYRVNSAARQGVAARAPGFRGRAGEITRHAVQSYRWIRRSTADHVEMRRKARALIALEHAVAENILSSHIVIRLNFGTRRIRKWAQVKLRLKAPVETIHFCRYRSL